MSKIKLAHTSDGRTLPTGMRGFFVWLQAKNPYLYERAMPRVRSPSLAGLGITGESAEIPSAAQSTAPVKPSLLDKFKDILAAAASTYLTTEQVKSQKKILDLQLQRAQAGLAPLDIDMAQYGMTPTANVGLSPDTKQLLIWGGVAAAAVFLIPKLLKR